MSFIEAGLRRGLDGSFDRQECLETSRASCLQSPVISDKRQRAVIEDLVKCGCLKELLSVLILRTAIRNLVGANRSTSPGSIRARQF